MKEVRIDLDKVKQEVGDIEFAYFKIGKLREHVAIQLMQKDKRISELQQGLRELVEDVKQYKQQNSFALHQQQEKQRVMSQEILQLEDRLLREEHCHRNLEQKLQDS